MECVVAENIHTIMNMYFFHRMFFCFNPPPPLEIPGSFSSRMPTKVFPLRLPSLLEFPVTLLGLSMDIFWKRECSGERDVLHVPYLEMSDSVKYVYVVPRRF